MISNRLRFIATFFLVIFSVTMRGQDSERYVCLTTTSGIVHCGTLVADDGREITLETPNLGKLILPKAIIIRIEDAPKGTVVNANLPAELSDRHVNSSRALQATRYFFAPSARSLKKGEGYGSFSVLTGGNLSFGLSESTIAGFSASWLGLGFNLKQSFKIKDNLYASFGGLGQISYRGTSGRRGSGYIFFPFANVTAGDENNQVTVGFGHLGGMRTRANFSWSTLTTELEERYFNSPMINLSGAVQVGQRTWIMSENYHFYDPEFFPVNTVYSLGIRLWNDRKKRLNEYAIMFFAEEDQTIPVPWLSWTWPF